MKKLDEKIYEIAKPLAKKVLDESGYEGEMRKVYKEGLKAGIKYVQELLKDVAITYLTDEGFKEHADKWMTENQCEN